MNKKISIGMVLLLYLSIAGIPGVLADLQEKNIIVRSNTVSCGSCHVDPGISKPEIRELSANNEKSLIKE